MNKVLIKESELVKLVEKIILREFYGDNGDADEERSISIYNSIFGVEKEYGPRDFVDTLKAIIDYARNPKYDVGSGSIAKAVATELSKRV